MKVRGSVILLPLLSLLLLGCPYESPYGIDDTAQLPIDESLIGKWATFVTKPGFEGYQKDEAIKIIFSKESDNEYHIAITGYLKELNQMKLTENDSLQCSGYLSEVSGKRFLNVFFRGRMYIAEVKQDAKGLSILALATQFTPLFPKKSADLRAAIAHHYRIRPVPMYDEYFVLRNLQRVN